MRVVELSSFVAAPLGGMTLAQLGAVVIVAVPGKSGYPAGFAVRAAVMAVVLPPALLAPRRRRGTGRGAVPDAGGHRAAEAR